MLWLTIISPSLLIAQSNATQSVTNEVEMADTFRQEGKIYVVVAVILLIFSGLIIYTIRIDQKVSKLEKELHNDLQG
ncbi:MAG: CcmD family protein [Cyclobacteriaceae bacterium]